MKSSNSNKKKKKRKKKKRWGEVVEASIYQTVEYVVKLVEKSRAVRQ